MTRCFAIALTFAASAGLLCHSDLWAGGKKDGKKAAKTSELVVEGELVNADVKDKVRQQSFCKVYAFKMTKGKSYQIDMASNAVDSYLRLENPDGNQVAADDDGGGFPNARIIYSAPQTGDFQIVATTFTPALGKFTLTVREVSSSDTNAKAIAMKLDKGEAKYTGNLAANDKLFMGKRHKLFVIDMKAGQTYVIDMKSAAIDSFLYLQGPKGAAIAEDDDSGNNLDAQITFKAAATGKYRIIATAFDAGSIGEFTLTVRRKD